MSAKVTVTGVPSPTSPCVSAWKANVSFGHGEIANDSGTGRDGGDVGITVGIVDVPVPVSVPLPVTTCRPGLVLSLPRARQV